MIKVQRRSCTFGHFKAVDDISFAVAAAEIFAFLGPSGAAIGPTVLRGYETPPRGLLHDPLTYGLDGLRAALINRSHFGASVDALVLVGVGAVLIVLGAWRFSKIEV